MATVDNETYQLWPLVLVITDGYDPQLAPLALEVVSEWDSEVCSLLFGFAGDRAREEMELN